jgi:phosphoribosylformimino-5-aminoimidazole carboxamide ribotide isomerase
MLIPSIDLMNGRVVQLRQGEQLMFATDDLEFWLDRFAPFPVVQVIDLDAALGRGDNASIVARLFAARPCQVGGGVRTPERARSLADAGAVRVIVGSALFDAAGVHAAAAAAFRTAIGDALVAAIDSRGGRVVVHGWKTSLAIGAVDAARELDRFSGAFLYTHVDTEGTLSGLDLAPVRELRTVTSKPLIVAGGIRSQEEVDALETIGVDAVVGMAIYTERIRV